MENKDNVLPIIIDIIIELKNIQTHLEYEMKQMGVPPPVNA